MAGAGSAAGAGAAIGSGAATGVIGAGAGAGATTGSGGGGAVSGTGGFFLKKLNMYMWGEGAACTCPVVPGTTNRLAGILPEQGRFSPASLVQAASAPFQGADALAEARREHLKQISRARFINWYKLTFNRQKSDFSQGMAMTISGYLKRIIWNDKVVVRGAVTLRAVLCGLFIALIALFFTSPVGEHSVYDKPLPLPAELGLE
jgi:hypothetical protein